MSEGLADEVAEFGVKVLIVEPGAFRTGLFETGRAGTSADSGVYGKVSETRGLVAGGDGTQPGDPAKAAALILAALDADSTPLRLPLGDDGVSAVLGHLDQVRDEVLAWEKRSRDTGFDR
jgi:NAD(P)-dependent dehydrogenase (short-subunit alcohol dehydrogenase family)